MTNVATPSHQAATPAIPMLGTPFFQSDESPEASRWGELFDVFGEAMDATTVRMQAAVPGMEDMVEGIEAASRRYAAMIEGMCMRASKPGAPCLSYELADGFSVLLLQTGPVSQEEIEAVEAVYEREEPPTSLPEQAFTMLLSGALHEFFSKNVPAGQVVTVSVSGCDYLFVRSSERDAALRDLKIGTAACQF